MAPSQAALLHSAEEGARLFDGPLMPRPFSVLQLLVELRAHSRKEAPSLDRFY